MSGRNNGVTIKIELLTDVTMIINVRQDSYSLRANLLMAPEKRNTFTNKLLFGYS